MLFVYGTLRESINHRMTKMFQEHARYTDRCYFIGKLYDVGSYPAAIPSDDKSDTVYGELIEMQEPNLILNKLDSYEGYDPKTDTGLYLRRKVEVYTVEKETPKRAWIYLFNRSVKNLAPIPSGDYLKYANQD